MDRQKVVSFQKILYGYFEEHGRVLPWRGTSNPYHILVSEIMLQQTQVDRVVEKFTQFINRFPTVESLAAASLSDVLSVWSGLGYNRRGKMIRECAITLVEKHGGKVPASREALLQLPGIGVATSASIAAFAFNLPEAFIETNIRAVIIHHFFPEKESVDDNDILALVTELLDRKNPYKWYSAMMDYGTHLKKLHPNPSRRSASHVRQSKFEGSSRQLRGRILKIVLPKPISRRKLLAEIGDDRVDEIIEGLLSEGLLVKKGSNFIVP